MASVRTRSDPLFKVTIENLSEGGVGMEINPRVFPSGVLLRVGGKRPICALPYLGQARCWM